MIETTNTERDGDSNRILCKFTATSKRWPGEYIDKQPSQNHEQTCPIFAKTWMESNYSCVNWFIEDDGNIYTGKAINFDGKNPWFPVKIFPRKPIH